MHEMSLVRPVVDIVLAQCEGRDVAAVRKVHLTIGEAHDVIDEYVPGLFRFLARGTAAADAEVEIRKVPITVRCNNCGEIFRIDVHDERTWVCPQCRRPRDYRLYSGREFSVDSIEVSNRVCASPSD